MSSLFDASDTAANLSDPSEAVNMVKDRKGGGAVLELGCYLQFNAMILIDGQELDQDPRSELFW